MIILHNTVDGETLVCCNSFEDDFVRFIVASRGILPNQLGIYHTEKTRSDADMKGRLQINSDALEVYETDYTGSAETEDFVITGESLIHTHAVEKLNYPYDENGNFNSSLWGLGE